MTPDNGPNVLVFAYGSNMLTQRIRDRVPSATPLAAGYVSHRKLLFRKRSDDGSGKADAAFTARATDRVWGVVYRLAREQKPVLDQYEFLGIGYDEEEVEAVHENGTFRAWMYLARPNAIDTSLLPYSWYHDLVVQGARQHGLPEYYIEYLKSFESLADPDSVRHERNLGLLKGVDAGQ